MSKQPAFTAHYSLKTGKRVKPAFAEKNPNSVVSFRVSPDFLRGKEIAIDKDGMPLNLAAAQMAKLKWDTHQAKLVLRRAKYAVKKAAAKKAAKKTAKKAVVKKVAQKIHKSAISGKIVSAAHAEQNPDTTYATKAKRVKKSAVPLI